MKLFVVFQLILRARKIIAAAIFSMSVLTHVNAQLIASVHLNEFNPQIIQYHFYDTAELRDMIGTAKNLLPKFPDSSMVIFRKIFEESKKTNYEHGILYSLLGMAFIDKIEGHYQEASNCYYEYLIAAESVNDISSTAFVYSNLASVLVQLGQIDKALMYLTISERDARAKKDFQLLGGILINKSFTYHKAKKLDSLLLSLEDALYVGTKYKNILIQSEALINLSSYYLERKMFSKALSNILEAQKILKEGDSHPIDYVQMLATLGEIYYTLHQYERSKPILFHALRNAERLKSAYYIMNINRLLSQLYEQAKEPAEAFQYYKAYTKLKDSAENKEVAENVSQLEIKYKTLEKDKEITKQQLLLSQKENNIKTKNLWIWSIASCFFILVIMLFVLFRSYQRKQQLQATTIHNMQQGQKISHLTAMMQGEEKERTRMARELHDGVGGLLSAAKMNFNSLYHLYDESPVYHNGIKLLDDAYDELRKTAHNLLPETLLHEGLVKAVRMYCNKIGERSLEISFHALGTVPRLNRETELSLYRIIQELINNVLKHAKATKALVQIDAEEDQLLIMVEDNGCGMMPASADNAQTGIGMKNLVSRVNVLGGQMEVDSRKDIGTTIYLEFNIHKFQNAEAV